MRTRHALAGLGALTLCLSLGAPAVAGQDGAGQDGTGRDQVKEQAKDQRQVQAQGRGKGHQRLYTFAVIGDTPYGAEMIARFPQDVDRINADKDVQLVMHVGDIKNGSSPCSDAYLTWMRGQLDRLEDPVVLTPGDNEWTDCHRPAAGGFDPLERLAKVRSVFYPQPGTTLGKHPMYVNAQTSLGFPENVMWSRAEVQFATAHVVGSNNGFLPWTGKTTTTPQQLAEAVDRTAAAVTHIRATYAEARRTKAKAVVIGMQADMFDVTQKAWSLDTNSAFVPVIKALTEESNRFGGATYLLDGDSHVFNDDYPLTAGSVWLQRYGLTTPAPRIHRITVDGEAAADEYLSMTVDPKAKKGSRDVLVYRRVPLT